MTTDAATTSREQDSKKPASAEKVLRRLFLTLFLRGRSARGLKRETAPKSVARKLALTLLFYGVFGGISLTLMGQPIFVLALYLHAMTFVFLGMFVASSAGEVLFNNEEADILLHRPIEPRTLLWTKVRVLVEISFWLAGAFNLVGLFVGTKASNGSWWFPVVHLISTGMEALFCTGCVVVIYQLCFRWFGREKLEGLMTAAQVAVSIAAVLSGQLLPQMMVHLNHLSFANAGAWWVALIPPAWFAGFDDALAGSPTIGAGVLGLCGIVATGIVLALAFGKLAQDYETGLQRLSERVGTKKGAVGKRRWIEVLVGMAPLRWWLRDKVVRSGFLLVTAYLARDRDVKLRVYPGMAPILVVPAIFLINSRNGMGAGGFGSAFSAAYLGVAPMLAMSILQYSQQYQASDLFRAAPIWGPGRIYEGARRAVLLFLAYPLALVCAGMILLMKRDPRELLLMLPGLMAIPVQSLMPAFSGAIPLSRPTEEGKSAGRGAMMLLSVFVAMLLAAVATWMWTTNYYWVLILGEGLACGGFYLLLRRALRGMGWPSLE